MKPVLIDLDGTILETRYRHYAVYSELLADFGHSPLACDEYWRRRREGNSTPALLADILDADERSQFSDRWLERVETREALALDTLFPDAVSALELMRETHDVVLVTLRRERTELMEQLEWLGIGYLFRQVISIGADRVQQKHLLPGIERVADGGYVVGDTEADIELGAHTRRNVVCVANGVRNAEFLAARGATTIVGSIGEVPAVLLPAATTRVA